jgi:hypothetical protein
MDFSVNNTLYRSDTRYRDLDTTDSISTGSDNTLDPSSSNFGGNNTTRSSHTSNSLNFTSLITTGTYLTDKS